MHPAGLLLVAASALAGATPVIALDVVSTTPDGYELAVPVGLATIAVEFDEAPALPASSAFRVSGVMSGLHPGTLDVVGSTLTFTNGGVAFLPGELVSVNLHRDIASDGGGGTLEGGYFFAFTIASGSVVPDWSTRRSYETAERPYFIYGGDLDADGHPDIALPNEDTFDVSVFLNTSGTGQFGPHLEYPVGQRPSSIFGEDLNNDGHVDLATADIVSSTMSVLINDGSGGFDDAVLYPAGDTTRQVHGGDFDGDNDVDICTTSYGTNQIHLFYNNGDGTFAAGVPQGSVGSRPFAIRTADVNRDGHLDIGVASQLSDDLTVLINDGTGSFMPTTESYSVGDGPWCLNGNDMDGDGDFDFVSVASFGSRAVVLYNDGTGAFETRYQAVTDDFPLGVFVADLDGDSDIDVTSSNFGGATVNIFDNDGTGALTHSWTLALPLAGTYTWAHDLDGDGDLDLSTVDELADSLFVYPNGGTVVPIDDGDPQVTPGHPVPQLSVWPNPTAARAGARARITGVARGENVSVDVFSADGRHVRRLWSAPSPGDVIVVDWDGRDAAGREVGGGRYLITASAGDERTTEAVAVVAR
jgi:hypothetical protein